MISSRRKRTYSTLGINLSYCPIQNQACGLLALLSPLHHHLCGTAKWPCRRLLLRHLSTVQAVFSFQHFLQWGRLVAKTRSVQAATLHVRSESRESDTRLSCRRPSDRCGRVRFCCPRTLLRISGTAYRDPSWLLRPPSCCHPGAHFCHQHMVYIQFTTNHRQRCGRWEPSSLSLLVLLIPKRYRFVFVRFQASIQTSSQ